MRVMGRPGAPRPRSGSLTDALVLTHWGYSSLSTFPGAPESTVPNQPGTVILSLGSGDRPEAKL